MPQKIQNRKRFEQRADVISQRLINAQELSKLLGLSVNTIYPWVSQRKIPFVKCGRLTRFDLQAIDEWIAENTVREERFEKVPENGIYNHGII